MDDVNNAKYVQTVVTRMVMRTSANIETLLYLDIH